MSITIDKEFESLIPPLSSEEFAQLEENCVKEGIRDALIVWKQEDGNQILVDGHNRFRISARHGGIPFNIKQMEFKDRDEVIVWIADNQLGRRNLHVLDREALMNIKRQAFSRQAKKRQATSTGGAKPQLRENLPQAGTGRVRDIIGKELGVSGRQVDKLHAINQKATPEIKQQVRDGELSVNQAYRNVMGIPPIPPKVDLAKEAEKRHEQFEQSKEEKTINFKDARQDKDDVNTIARTMALEFETAMNKLLNVDRLSSISIDNIRNVERTESAKSNFKRQIRDCIKLLIHIERILNDW